MRKKIIVILLIAAAMLTFSSCKKNSSAINDDILADELKSDISSQCESGSECDDISLSKQAADNTVYTIPDNEVNADNDTQNEQGTLSSSEEGVDSSSESDYKIQNTADKSTPQLPDIVSDTLTDSIAKATPIVTNPNQNSDKSNDSDKTLQSGAVSVPQTPTGNSISSSQKKQYNINARYAITKEPNVSDNSKSIARGVYSLYNNSDKSSSETITYTCSASSQMTNKLAAEVANYFSYLCGDPVQELKYGLSFMTQTYSKNGEITDYFYKISFVPSDVAEQIFKTKAFLVKIDNIISLLDNPATVEEYCMSAAQYIIDNTSYDLSDHNIYATAMTGKGVCQGYATEFVSLLRRVGIDSDFLGGYSNNQAHAWNCVYLPNGDVSYYDVTFADTANNNNWLNMTYDEISKTHKNTISNTLIITADD